MINLNPKPEKRNKLYYGKYKYAITAIIPFAYSLRDCRTRKITRQKLDSRIETRFRLLSQSKLLFKHTKWLDLIGPMSLDEVKEMMYGFYDRIRHMEFVQINFTADNIIIYSNDLSCIDELGCFKKCKGKITVREANVTLEKDSIFRKNSKYKFRVYLKQVKDARPNNKNVLNFLTTYKDHTKPSPTLKLWAQYESHRGLQEHSFFDLDDVDLVTVFSIMAPGIKTRLIRVISDKYS